MAEATNGATPKTLQAPAARSLTIEWQDPTGSAAIAARMTGLEAMRALMRGEIPPPPIALLLGMRPVRIDEGNVVFAANPGEQHYNPIGIVHGGLAATLIDSATGCAVHTTLPKGSGYATIDLNVNYDRPITSITGRVLCEAEIVNRGSKIITAQARLTSERSGKLLAHGSATCMVIEP